MSGTIRIWSTDGADLTELPRQAVGLEARLEDWMDADIDILSNDLLVIGRQLDTDGGGTLDLLCLDRAGDVVVVELKRGKTPREAVAQVLDYAAWASTLSYEDLHAIYDRYRREATELADAFHNRFGVDLPEVLNAGHHLLIVASETDPRTERIVRYLSEAHGVSINSLSFNYFETTDGRGLLARQHLLEPDTVEDRTVRKPGSKRRRTPTLDEHRETAHALGVGDLYDRLVDGLSSRRRPDTARSQITFYFRDSGGGYIAAFNVLPLVSGYTEGLRFNAYTYRLARLFGLTQEGMEALLPANVEPWAYSTDASAPRGEWGGLTGAFSSLDEIDRFLSGLRASPQGLRAER